MLLYFVLASEPLGFSFSRETREVLLHWFIVLHLASWALARAVLSLVGLDSRL